MSNCELRLKAIEIAIIQLGKKDKESILLAAEYIFKFITASE